MAEQKKHDEPNATDLAKLQAEQQKEPEPELKCSHDRNPATCKICAQKCACGHVRGDHTVEGACTLCWICSEFKVPRVVP